MARNLSARAIEEQQLILLNAANVLRGYQGSDAQDTASMIEDLADQLGLRALHVVGATVGV